MNHPFTSSPADPSADPSDYPSADAPPRPNTYSENVPRPAEPLTQPHPHQAPAPTRSWWSPMWH
ncbi:MAG: hypothetical protein L0H46_06400, partial [Brevibacterium sp.]|nr:hypothetical protein [Brevibacterium sp.]